MDRRKLISEIARDTDYRRWEVEEVFDKAIKVIAEVLERGEDVTISGFGRFTPKYYAPRKGYNPKTSEQIEIAEKALVAFIPSKKMTISQEALKQLAQQAKEKK